jgi:hypothetical protein
MVAAWLIAPLPSTSPHVSVLALLPPALSEGSHRSLMRVLVAAGRRAAFVMTISDGPHPLPILQRCLRHANAPNYSAVRKHILVVVVVAERRMLQAQCHDFTAENMPRPA